MTSRFALLLAALLATPAAAVAQTLETVVNLLAYPAGAPMDADGGAKWAAIAKFPGIKWRGRVSQMEGGKAMTTRSGSVALSGLGNTSIGWAGLPDRAFEADLRTGARLRPDQYLGMLKSQFSPAAKVRTVRGGCKDPAFAQSAIFEVALPGKQPAYLLIDTQPTWHDGYTTIQVSPFDQSTSAWSC
jgi:hypothetical protein